MSSTIDRFVSLPWLSELDAEAKRELALFLEEDRAAAGALLSEQGRDNPVLSFVLEGTVALSRTYPDGFVDRIANLSAQQFSAKQPFSLEQLR